MSENQERALIEGNAFVLGKAILRTLLDMGISVDTLQGGIMKHGEVNAGAIRKAACALAGPLWTLWDKSKAENFTLVTGVFGSDPFDSTEPFIPFDAGMIVGEKDFGLESDQVFLNRMASNYPGETLPIAFSPSELGFRHHKFHSEYMLHRADSHKDAIRFINERNNYSCADWRDLIAFLRQKVGMAGLGGFTVVSAPVEGGQRWLVARKGHIGLTGKNELDPNRTFYLLRA